MAYVVGLNDLGRMYTSWVDAGGVISSGTVALCVNLTNRNSTKKLTEAEFVGASNYLLNKS